MKRVNATLPRKRKHPINKYNMSFPLPMQIDREEVIGKRDI